MEEDEGVVEDEEDQKSEVGENDITNEDRVVKEDVVDRRGPVVGDGGINLNKEREGRC